MREQNPGRKEDFYMLLHFRSRWSFFGMAGIPSRQRGTPAVGEGGSSGDVVLRSLGVRLPVVAVLWRLGETGTQRLLSRGSFERMETCASGTRDSGVCLHVVHPKSGRLTYRENKKGGGGMKHGPAGSRASGQ